MKTILRTKIASQPKSKLDLQAGIEFVGNNLLACHCCTVIGGALKFSLSFS